MLRSPAPRAAADSLGSLGKLGMSEVGRVRERRLAYAVCTNKNSESAWRSNDKLVVAAGAEPTNRHAAHVHVPSFKSRPLSTQPDLSTSCAPAACRLSRNRHVGRDPPHA
jgi:hypothetical protein